MFLYPGYAINCAGSTLLKKLFRYTIGLFAVLFLIATGLFAYGRLQGASPEQQAALALLKQKPTYSESENLAPYLWLINYAVPQDRINEITAADAKKYNALTSSREIGEFQSQAATKYTKLDLFPDAFSGLCQFKKGQSCLSEVRKDKEKIAETLSKLANEIARAEKVSDYRVYYSPFEMHMVGAMPSVSAGENLLRVQRADLFLSGEENTAIEKVCSDITAWRSISSNSDTLLVAMVSHAYVRNRLSLLADMLTNTDQNTPLPQQCKLALKATTPDENLLCNAMRGEFNIIENFDVWMADASAENVSASNKIKHRAANLFYDHKRTLSLAALRNAIFCGDDALAAAKANSLFNFSEKLDKKTTTCGMADRVSNYSGCVIIDASISAYYETYLGRRLDQSAEITAMQILLWLREQKATSENVEQAFSARPDNLKAFSERIDLNTAAGVIEVDLHSPAGDGETTWSLPLPISMLAK